MKQEPVGVVCEFEGCRVGTLFEQLPDGTKLYSQPQYRELSDDEIIKVYEDCNTFGERGIIAFAKALLKRSRDA